LKVEVNFKATTTKNLRSLKNVRTEFGEKLTQCLQNVHCSSVLYIFTWHLCVILITVV